MRRSILTGFAVCFLSAGLPALASAQTSEPSAPAVTTTAPVSAEVAAPTDGADLTMWNAAPSQAEDTAAAAKHAADTGLIRG